MTEEERRELAELADEKAVLIAELVMLREGLRSQGTPLMWARWRLRELLVDPWARPLWRWRFRRRLRGS